MSKEKDVIFTWNLSDNIEIDHSEVGKKYEIIWSSSGIPIIITPKCAIYKGLNIMSFDIDKETLK